MLVLLLATWVFARPWGGFWHDGQLYALQALQRLEPARFQNDLYFMFGSQDSFTLFSPLLATFIKAFGLESGARILHLIGALLWQGAALFLISAFLRGAPLWLAAACLLLLPTDYDPIKALGLAEPFLTPRFFAEALSMLAIACAVRGKSRWAVPLLILSLSLHPLLTVGPLLFCMLFLSAGRGRLLAVVLLAGAGCALALGALAIGPFDRLLQTMDAHWYSYVARLSPMVAWDSWKAEMNILGRTVVAASLVLTAAWLFGGWRARFYYCIALTGAAGLLATWVGTSLFHNLLVIQVQPWRVLWLLQVASVIALFALWATCWRRGRLFRILLLALTCGVLARDGYGALIAACSGAALCWLDGRPALAQLPGRTYGLLLGGVAVLALTWLLEIMLQSDRHLFPITWWYGWQGSDAGWLGWTFARLGGAALLGCAVILWGWRWGGRPQLASRLAAGALAACSLAAAVAWTSDYMGYAPQVSAAASRAIRQQFVPLIPAQATVYWHRDPEFRNDARLSWFLLGRASYASIQQVYGMVFNRGTAMEGMRRLERLQRLGVADSLRNLDKSNDAALPSQPSLEGLQYVCADPQLDFVVLYQRFGTAPVAHVRDAEYKRDFYLYDCARLRRVAASN
jgi:hypothetical protein